MTHPGSVRKRFWQFAGPGLFVLGVLLDLVVIFALDDAGRSSDTPAQAAALMERARLRVALSIVALIMIATPVVVAWAARRVRPRAT